MPLVGSSKANWVFGEGPDKAGFKDFCDGEEQGLVYPARRDTGTLPREQSVAQLVNETITQVWEELEEAMEQDFQLVLKKFWQTVQQARRGKQNPVHGVLSVGRELLTSTESTVQQWKEYFKELLNPTIPRRRQSQGLWAGLSHHWCCQTTTQWQFLVMDEIRPKVLRALDVVGLSWLTCLCNFVWTSGTVSSGWQTGVAGN